MPTVSSRSRSGRTSRTSCVNGMFVAGVVEQEGAGMSDQPQTPIGPDLTVGIPTNSLDRDVPLIGHVQGGPVILVCRGSETFAIGGTCRL